MTLCHRNGSRPNDDTGLGEALEDLFFEVIGEGAVDCFRRMTQRLAEPPDLVGRVNLHIW